MIANPPSVILGLDPRIHAKATPKSMAGYVYIMTNGKRGTLYIGVTADLEGRVFDHREGRGSEFTRRYGLTRLVWYEQHDHISDAIQREKSLKSWYRKWKIDLIEAMNPDWDDLYLVLNN